MAIPLRPIDTTAREGCGASRIGVKKNRWVFNDGYVIVLVTMNFVQWPPRRANTKPSQEAEEFTVGATAPKRGRRSPPLALQTFVHGRSGARHVVGKVFPPRDGSPVSGVR